jgi:GAF domain-containing protein
VSIDVPPDGQELARTVANLREQQRASGSVLRSVARGVTLQAVLDEVVEAATRLTASRNARLWLVRDGLLHVVANFGSQEGLDFDQQPRVPDRTTMAGRTAVTRDVVHLPDVNADPEYTYAGPRFFRSGLSVPILLEDELIGVINITREEVGPFADEHIELLRSFADQAAIAIAVERQRSELLRFLSPQVAELISSPQGEQLLAGHRAYITCLFCDLRGFTAFAETAAPEELFDVLRAYHQSLGELIAIKPSSWVWRLKSGSESSPSAGTSEVSNSDSAWVSTPAMRRLAGSVSKGGTTMAQSDLSPTSRPGSAATLRWAKP